MLGRNGSGKCSAYPPLVAKMRCGESGPDAWVTWRNADERYRTRSRSYASPAPTDTVPDLSGIVALESPIRSPYADGLPMRAVPGDTVGFAKIDEFKGLENDTVMVADLLEPRFSERDPVPCVVATARPRSVLARVSRTFTGLL